MAGLVASVGVVAATMSWVRMNRLTAEGDPAQFWVREGSRAYGRMPSVSLDQPDALAGLLAESLVLDPDALLAAYPTSENEVRDAVATFLLRRISSQDAAQYTDAMTSAGYRIITAPEYDAAVGRLDRLARLVGATSSEPSAVLDAAWNAPRARAAEWTRVCSDPRAVLIVVGHTNHNRFFTQDGLGDLGRGLWRGGVATVSRYWFIPPRTRAAVLQADRRVLAARASLIFENRAGTRHPVFFNLFFDPASARWWFDSGYSTNVEGNDAMAPCLEY